MRLSVDERQVLRAFQAEGGYNPVRSYEEATAGLTLSAGFPALLALVRAGLVRHLKEDPFGPDGYVLTDKGFAAVEDLRQSRIDG